MSKNQQGVYRKNQSKDGWMPTCGNCHKSFQDGDMGEVKNYPEDGIIAVFFTCPSCNLENEFIYKPYKIEKELQVK